MPANTAIGSGLAGRYATALFELAREHDALDAVAADLDGLRALIDESADLRRLIASPVIGRDEQGRAIATIAERAGCQALTARFLGVMARQRRLFTLPQTIDAFRQMLAADRGEVTAEVTSAAALGDEQLAALRDTVGEQVGRSVTLVHKIDPRLLGGLVVRVGSRMIDASLRTKLHHLELAMKGAG